MYESTRHKIQSFTYSLKLNYLKGSTCVASMINLFFGFYVSTFFNQVGIYPKLCSILFLDELNYGLYILMLFEKKKSDIRTIQRAKVHALRKSPVVCAATSSSKERL